MNKKKADIIIISNTQHSGNHMDGIFLLRGIRNRGIEKEGKKEDTERR
jgi:hypothetical protein